MNYALYQLDIRQEIHIFTIIQSELSAEKSDKMKNLKFYTAVINHYFIWRLRLYFFLRVICAQNFSE